MSTVILVSDEDKAQATIYFGNYSDGGYRVERLGRYLPDQRRHTLYGAQVRQQCDPADVPGREPLGTIVAGPFWGADADLLAARAASALWRAWAIRVGRNCPTCLGVPAYCRCTPRFVATVV